eukprot:5562437-Prymnesium_polylepis.1
MEHARAYTSRNVAPSSWSRSEDTGTFEAMTKEAAVSVIWSRLIFVVTREFGHHRDKTKEQSMSSVPS